MDIWNARLLVMALSLALAVPAQATTQKVITYFDSINTVQFLQNDWNPPDGDTRWGAIGVENRSSVLIPILLIFSA